jgi:error-prone DNA polymerase
MKVDVLALGMLSCMKRGFDLLAEHKGIDARSRHHPAEDPRTYAMIRKADTLGTFQIESRAQMSMLPRLKPRTFYDLVVEVAIVRPGPIQGDMVHPYLRRREGKEPVEYPKPELEKVLGKTLGVPLFQEQAMRVAIECAGFTPGEADQLRKRMATFKFTGGVEVQGQADLRHGRQRLRAEFAEKTFKQLEGFGSYGFPESHAASFALIAYASSWLKCWHPDVFCAALLNAQPMGFYAPAQIVRDARAHGVEVRPVCINASRWDCTLEPDDEGRFAVRLGLRMVKGSRQRRRAKPSSRRADQPFASVDDLWRRAGVPSASLVQARRGRCLPPVARSLRAARRSGRSRRCATSPCRCSPPPIRGRRSVPEVDEPVVALRPMTAGGEVVEDYGHVGLTLREPPRFLPARRSAPRRRIVTCAEAMAGPRRRWLEAAGLVLVRQRPGSAKGVMFITIEDETGIANLVVWPKVFEKYRRVVLGAGMIGVRGRIQREGRGRPSGRPQTDRPRQRRPSSPASDRQVVGSLTGSGSVIVWRSQSPGTFK